MAYPGTGMIAGRYAVAAVLGAGGMATVYRARDEVLGRDVAVKVLNSQFAADADFLARFEREARDVAVLSHPRIVTIFDCGFHDQAPFIVMELAPGRTLRQVLDEGGPLPADQAVMIAAQVCEALAAAHTAGLVHRDIKPANIMLCDGAPYAPDEPGQAAQVKVLDFGIARLEGLAGGAPTRAVLGTAAYLSPEQAAGRPAGLQSDLYALGCVLFEMLTGVPPFSGGGAVALAYRHVHDEPGPPSARRSGLSPQFDRVTARLLAKDPAARPASAAAARAALLAALATDRTAPHTAVLDPADADETPDQQPARRRPGLGRRGGLGGRSGLGGSAGHDRHAELAGLAGFGGPVGQPRIRPRLTEILLGLALTATLAVLVIVLLTEPSAAPGSTGSSTPGSHQTSPAPAGSPGGVSPAADQHGAAPTRTARAAAAMVSALTTGLADGEASQQAAQSLYNQLQQVLFQSGQDAQQIDQQYGQLVQTYDQYVSQGQISGHAATNLQHALQALGNALGVP